jgi:hypothetical protein
MIGVDLESREILVTLARRYGFRELAYLLGAGVTGLAVGQRDLARIQQLCAYGQRLMDVDAANLAEADAATGATTDTTFAILVSDERVPHSLLSRGVLCHVRRKPEPADADVLVDLRPLFRLLLEALTARWARYETLRVLALAHVAAEYSPLLAWQPYLGHAGDPFRLRDDAAFTGPGSRWGHIDDPGCPRPRQEKAASARALRVAGEPASGWRSYLDRQHSVVARAFVGCATDCATPCTVMTHLDPLARTQVAHASRAAVAYGSCALIRLRHGALVGHGLGAPSRDEVARAWEHSRASISRHGPVGSAVLTEDGYPLPGLPSLFSAIADTPLRPDTLLADARDAVVRDLDPDGLVWSDPWRG